MPSAPDKTRSDAVSPSDVLISTVNWEEVEELVRTQQRNREVHTPPISLYRWWARRPHALIGAVLDAACAHGTAPPVVSDPFSGGGTVAVEAVARGLATYAQDLHPWAVEGLRGALEDVDPDELALASSELLTRLDDTRRRLYGGVNDEGRATEVATALWVRRVNCPCCEHEIFLYPHSFVSRASRSATERWGWWGCVSCGGVTRSALSAKERRCSKCRRRLEPADRSLLPDRQVQCPRRRCGHRFDGFAATPSWSMALVQRWFEIDDRAAVELDEPTDAERLQGGREAQGLPQALINSIPHGLETAVLHRTGMARWKDLYVPRQVTSLLEAGRTIDTLSCSAPIRRRLLLAVCGAGEMAGHISRWDRHYTKAYEAAANHRFAVTGLSAEINVLGERGRGILRSRLAASIKAAEWRRNHVPPKTRLRKRASTARRLAPVGVVLAEGSSDRQLPTRGSVDLVLTDPPYFDDVQYGELAALFMVWAQAIGLIADSIEVDLRSEAVANARRGTDADRYRRLLATIFRETQRTLRDDGRMILTYHNTDLRAWWALGHSLADAGFAIQALAVTWAENDADHSKRGRRGFTHDLVIECRRSVSNEPLVLDDHSTDQQSQELIAAGRAIAAMTKGETLDEFRERYRRLRGAVENPLISPTSKERHDG